MYFLPWQHAEVTGVSLIFVVDDMPVGVVHLDALPKHIDTESWIRGSTHTQI